MEIYIQKRQSRAISKNTWRVTKVYYGFLRQSIKLDILDVLSLSTMI